MSNLDQWKGSRTGQAVRLISIACCVALPLIMIICGAHWFSTIMTFLIFLSITIFLSWSQIESNINIQSLLSLAVGVGSQNQPLITPRADNIRIVGPVGSGKSLLILSLRHGLGDNQQNTFSLGQQLDLLDDRLQCIQRGIQPGSTPAGTVEWFEFSRIGNPAAILRVESTAGEDFEHYDKYQRLLSGNRATVITVNPLQLYPELAKRVFYKLASHAGPGQLHEAIFTAAELVWGLVESQIRKYLDGQSFALNDLDQTWQILEAGGQFTFASPDLNDQRTLVHHQPQFQRFDDALSLVAEERERITRPYIDRGLRASTAPTLIVLTRLDLLLLANLNIAAEILPVKTWLRGVNGRSEFFEVPLFRTEVLAPGAVLGADDRLQQRVRIYPLPVSYDFWVQVASLGAGGPVP